MVAFTHIDRLEDYKIHIVFDKPFRVLRGLIDIDNNGVQGDVSDQLRIS